MVSLNGSADAKRVLLLNSSSSIIPQSQIQLLVKLGNLENSCHVIQNEKLHSQGKTGRKERKGERKGRKGETLSSIFHLFEESLLVLLEVSQSLLLQLRSLVMKQKEKLSLGCVRVLSDRS